MNSVIANISESIGFFVSDVVLPVAGYITDLKEVWVDLKTISPDVKNGRINDLSGDIIYFDPRNFGGTNPNMYEFVKKALRITSDNTYVPGIIVIDKYPSSIVFDSNDFFTVDCRTGVVTYRNSTNILKPIQKIKVSFKSKTFRFKTGYPNSIKDIIPPEIVVVPGGRNSQSFEIGTVKEFIYNTWIFEIWGRSPQEISQLSTVLYKALRYRIPVIDFSQSGQPVQNGMEPRIPFDPVPYIITHVNIEQSLNIQISPSNIKTSGQLDWGTGQMVTSFVE